MQRFKQNTPFKILELDTNIWKYPIHTHNHFEIVFIKEGSGTHTINNISFQYRDKDIFILSPGDSHIFNINSNTKFYFIKFTESLFTRGIDIINKKRWIEKIESVLLNPNLLPGDIKYEQKDKDKMFQLLDIIIEENYYDKEYKDSIISDTVSIIISLISRNICKIYCEKQINNKKDKNRMNDIFSYIQENIYINENLKIDNIANHLNLSKNYISIFFKKNYGESLQHYILKYRLIIAENRIRLSDYTISEIAYQLGFSDESHFNKAFKKKYNMNPGEYRKRNI